MTLKKLSFGILSLYSCACFGQTVVMDETKTLNVPVSKKGITRIKVTNTKIKNFYAYPLSERENISLHESGQLFLVGEAFQEPLYLSVVTTEDKTQDMKVLFQKSTPEPVLLKEPEVKKTFTSQDVQKILSDFVDDNRPNGFKEIGAGDEHRTTPMLHSRALRAWERDSLYITLFEVLNPGEKMMDLSSKSLARPGDVGVAVVSQSLEPKAKSYFFVARKKGS